MAREQVTFVEIDTSTLAAEVQETWARYLEAKAALKAALNEHHAPKGKRLVFTEKYNKLKIAAVAQAAPKSASVASLADFLDGQAASGASV